jgi:hypothetical protein
MQKSKSKGLLPLMETRKLAEGISPMANATGQELLNKFFNSEWTISVCPQTVITL